MSDLLNSASLVLIPSGYSEDKVYSAVPTDGSGDLSFTRSSNGTRINSAGLVEVVPWNEAQQSNTFGTSPWSNTLDTGATLTYTANYGTAPDGTTTAGRLQMALNGSNYAQKNQIISVITGQQYTYSVWMRSLSGTKTIIFCYDNTNNISATVTTEWQRFTATFTGNSQVYCRFVLESGTSTSVDLLIYGAQLNIGATAKPYFPTTDRLNVPRLTYQNGGGGCPSLLLEKQSTNYARNNNDLTGWTKITGTDTISLNAGTSPDGTANGINLIPSTANGTHMFYDGSTSVSSSGNFTMTCYVKANGYSKFAMRESASVGYYASFNLSNGTVLDNGGNTASIENLGNGWYRCICSVVASTTVQIGLLVLSDSYTSGQPFGLTWSGDGTKGILVYGPQLEVSASYATSLISTAGVASATRVADACFKTGISSLIGQTEGVLFIDVEYGNQNNEIYAFLQDSLGNSITSSMYLQRTADGYVTWQGWNASTIQQFAITATGYVTGQRLKIAGAYKANDFILYINGTLIGTDTSGTVPTCTALQLGTYPASPTDPIYMTSKPFNQAVLFKTRLTNAELASLTTL